MAIMRPGAVTRAILEKRDTAIQVTLMCDMCDGVWAGFNRDAIAALELLNIFECECGKGAHVVCDACLKTFHLLNGVC